ncbi:hypothetical protein [Carboxydothermus ferrireducens]|uniref:CMP-2-keto-3-deoxyoctulosonic acid synthetase n=1 Tax=Carboxydothermus ferrireducens DSM 11255 TaxID=1119529 RepID=A0ABX2RD97_9THEO|nr:hypothetical protein [Carboxydothermus ferrireducens]NYE58839.1 CMP-2-keto-3-deoxyoctulosonic acid synthetase [Carboxydothermus ferrireducens DSM 11255]
MKILISPLGMSPGLLYSALYHVKPDFLFCLTSEKGKEKLPEIMEKAGYMGGYSVFIVDDPFTSFHKTEEVWKSLKDLLDSDAEIVVNITGGTTALQYLVQKTAERLESQGFSVKTVALIDRRSRSEQESNPYVPGKIFYL